MEGRHARGTARSRRNVLGEIVVLRSWPLLPLSAALVVDVISTVALAQPAPSSNYTSFEATSAKPVQLGYYASANKDCTPAPIPTIRVIEAPKSGTFTVGRGELTKSGATP